MLGAWANSIIGAAFGGHLDGKPIVVQAVQPVVGPRAGALLLKVGRTQRHARHAGRMVKALSVDDHAALRSLLPPGWKFTNGQPLCYMEGKLVRVEAPWPGSLSQAEIRLNRLAQAHLSHGARLGRWIAGQSEKGVTVTLGLDDATPHFLLAGMTGSGKSVALQGMVTQLAQDSRHRLILLDGKWGESLTMVSHSANMVGPLCMELDAAMSAVGWLVKEMKRRYALKLEGRLPEDRLVLVWDEPQEWLKEQNLADLVQLLVRDGRAVGVHLVLATHHPVVGVFGGPEAKRNIPGRIALRVSDSSASQVALGFSKPSAATLTGAGDCILSTPKVMALRAQIAYVDSQDFQDIPSGEPELEEWPDYTSPELGQANQADFGAEDIAAGLLAEYAGKGRPTLRRWIGNLTGAGMPGGSRSQRIQAHARLVYGILTDRLGLGFDQDQIDAAVQRIESTGLQTDALAPGRKGKQ